MKVRSVSHILCNPFHRLMILSELPWLGSRSPPFVKYIMEREFWINRPPPMS